MEKTKGIVYTIISAMIFGFTPILAKYTFQGGSNAVMLTFFRACMVLPLLYIILKYQRIPLNINKKLLKQIIILCIFGSSLTTVSLYAAYDYISVGMATTIHFVYPSLVIVGCALFFKEPPNFYKILALILSTIGIIMFFDGNMSSGLLGILIAFFSGVTYAFYIVYMDKTELRNMPVFKLTFYICVVNSVIMLIFGLVTNQLTFSLTPQAWINSFVVAVFTSIGAISLLQLGIKYIGASMASILCTFEPITSVLLGILLLGENFTLKTILGCVLIMVAVIVLTISREEVKMEIGQSSQEVNIYSEK